MNCRRCKQEYDPNDVFYDDTEEDQDLEVTCYGLCDDCAIVLIESL